MPTIRRRQASDPGAAPRALVAGGLSSAEHGLMTAALRIGKVTASETLYFALCRQGWLVGTVFIGIRLVRVL